VSFFICVERFVDPDLGRNRCWFRCLVDEAFGMDAIGGIEHGLALFENERGLVVVHHGWGEQAQPGMAVFLVVPAEKSLRKSPAILNTAETIRKLRSIFHGAELTFRIRIVVGDVWAAVRFGDTQVGQQKSHWLGTHRGAAIGMQRELSGPDVLFCTTLLDQPLGQFRALAHRHHPTGNVAAEHIEDHVKIKVRPLGRPQQFDDVPTPELIGRGGQQFWLLVRRMSKLVAALTRFAFLFEQAIRFWWMGKQN
jgi:hypothetical protein